MSIRFISRRALSKLPFLPVPLRIAVNSEDDVRFWWSYLPVHDDPHRLFLDYPGGDEPELRFLWEFLKPEMTFLDIGAHHGIFSLLASRRLSRGRVIAFEPSPRERDRFGLHLRMNRIGNVRIEPYAVAARAGAVDFFAVSSELTTMNGLRPPPIGTTAKISVEAISLDEYLAKENISGPSIAKIDVEGGELEAFRGATRMLQSARPLLICEVLDWVTQPWGYRAREIVRHLQGCEYDWFDFSPAGKISPHVTREDYPETRNYLAVPREKLSLVDAWIRSGATK